LVGAPRDISLCRLERAKERARGRKRPKTRGKWEGEGRIRRIGSDVGKIGGIAGYPRVV
jgi:hypothetical protein